MRLLFVAAVGLLALAGCTTPRVPDACPETRNTKCLTTPVCEIDRRRDCEVCRCAPPGYVPPERMEPAPARP